VIRDRRRVDHLFFSGMAVLILATVFVGFARTYYLAGVFNAPLPSRLIHVHGAAFSCWILLLVTQTSLVAAGRVDLHRRLGLLGFGLAGLMVILGLLAATERLSVAPGPAVAARAFYAIPVADMLLFATLIYAAFRARFDRAAHKRLILIATIALLDAAFARWPIRALASDFEVAQICGYVFLAVLMAYDVWSIGRVHRATLWASVWMIVLYSVRIPLGHTAPWQLLATDVVRLAHWSRLV
jgi:hypothetical protein